MNPVKRRIWELGRFELGRRKRYIIKVCRKEISPNKRYAWLLYAAKNDPEPVETVVLDVNLADALAIDLELGIEVQPIPKTSAPGSRPSLL